MGIAKILATLQPRITSAVQSAVGQTSTVRVAPRPVASYRPAVAPARPVAVAPRPAIRVAPRPVTSYRPAVAVAPARYGPSVSSFGQNSFTRSSSGSADQSSIVKSVISSPFSKDFLCCQLSPGWIQQEGFFKPQGPDRGFQGFPEFWGLQGEHWWTLWGFWTVQRQRSDPRVCHRILRREIKMISDHDPE